MLRLAPRAPEGVILPSAFSISKMPSSSFTRLVLRPCWELILCILIMSPDSGSCEKDPFCGRGLPRVGVDEPMPLPKPENMRPNSLLIPGSLPIEIGWAWAPCTACGSGDARPVLLVASRLKPMCDLDCCIASPIFMGPSKEDRPPDENERASGSVRCLAIEVGSDVGGVWYCSTTRLVRWSTLRRRGSSMP